MSFLTEDDIIEIINDQLDYSIENQDMEYSIDGQIFLEKNIEMVLTDDTVMVEYTIDKEELIPTLIYGEKLGFNQAGDSYQADWSAELEEVQWDSSIRMLTATYVISRD